MSVFVSYSHHDKHFANTLAANLMSRRIRVWVDTWELKAGDSLLARVQEALDSSSALVVVLSKHSVASEWCKKELNAGLLRELEEQRVVVVPALLEDCHIPVFLREKKYADFRERFDDGLSDVIEAIAAVTADGQGRIDRPPFHMDWSIDWGSDASGLYRVIVTVLEHGESLPFSLLTEVTITANALASMRQAQYEAADVGWWGRRMILEMASAVVKDAPLQLILEDERAVDATIPIVDARLGYEHVLHARSRRLGEDTGKNIFVDVGAQIQSICASSGERQRAPTPQELQTIQALLVHATVAAQHDAPARDTIGTGPTSPPVPNKPSADLKASVAERPRPPRKSRAAKRNKKPSARSKRK